MSKYRTLDVHITVFDIFDTSYEGVAEDVPGLHAGISRFSGCDADAVHRLVLHSDDPLLVSSTEISNVELSIYRFGFFYIIYRMSTVE